MGRVTKIIVCLVAIFVAVNVTAQERYERVVRHNAWNLGGGAAGLRTDSLSTTYAELYGMISQGGFRPISTAWNEYRFGAELRSVYHLKKVSFSGGFGFDYRLGNKMCGSMFSNPGYYPVDIMEFTPGRKNQERYVFEGGVSVELGKGLLFGLNADVEAISYAKRKDLRHKNNALDFGVAPSLTYRFKNGAVGVTYMFSKNSENISANTYGISSEDYYAFFDKGMCYGVSELWNGSGIHLNDTGISGFPISEMVNGAMVQAEWHGIYADVSYRHASGNSGEKLTILHEFYSDEISAHIAAHFCDHWYLRGGFSYYGQTNNENVMNPVTENGVTTMQKFGSNPIFSRRRTEATFEAEYSAAKWEVVVGAKYNELNRLSTLIYPLYRTHDMWSVGLSAEGRVEVWHFEISASLSGSFGGVSRGEGAVASTDGVVGEYPQLSERYLVAEEEWYSASRIGASVALRYNIKWGIYLDMRADFTHAFGTTVLGHNRLIPRIGLGYKF